MPRGKKSGDDHHGFLHTAEQEYLAALRFSQDHINRKISALESILGIGLVGRPAKTSAKTKSPPKQDAAGKAAGIGKKKPRNYELLKAKIATPMAMVEMLDALGMKPKQEGTLRRTMQNYPGLFKSNGKRPATYTLDTSR